MLPIFAKPDLVDRLCKHISDLTRGQIDAVVALEARGNIKVIFLFLLSYKLFLGFLFGPQVAINLGVPFIAIRKKGKLPGQVINAKYVKEYGEV